jgi:zinc-RING finger domain
MDLHTLDSYLVSLLASKLSDNWVLSSFIPRHWHFPLLQMITLICTQGQTPATRIMGLRLVSATRVRLILYASVACLVPPLYQVLKDWYHNKLLLLREEAEPTRIKEIRQFARERQGNLCRMIINTFDRVSPILGVGLLLGCWTRLLDTSYPALWISECRLECYNRTGATPPFYVDYAHRRWLYEQGAQTTRAMLEGLAWLTTVWKSPVQDLIKHAVTLRQQLFESKLPRKTERNTSCPSCRQETPTIPFVTNCGHIYCYACLYQASQLHSSFQCAICRVSVYRAKPFCPMHQSLQ